MNIARLSSLTLGLVIAAFSFGYMNPSVAGKPDPITGCHDHKEGDCGGDPPGETGDGKAKFSVAVEGLTSGVSLHDHPWRTTSKHGIGESDPHFDKLALVNFDASHFAANTIPGGANCFGASTTVREASIRERRGAMESIFWFDGETNDDDERETVTYILRMDGTTAGDFPPDTAPLQVNMGQWRINVANGQSEVEPFACDESSGTFEDDSGQGDSVPNPVLITVTPQP